MLKHLVSQIDAQHLLLIDITIKVVNRVHICRSTYSENISRKGERESKIDIV